MGCIHVRKAQTADRVEALLVGDDEDDVGLLFGHGSGRLFSTGN
jgi:hypothetical protein